jgi:Rieske Fe-S protein
VPQTLPPETPDVQGASRRGVLMGAAATVTTGALAACSSGSGTPTAAGPVAASTPAVPSSATTPKGHPAAPSSPKPTQKPAQDFAQGALAPLSSVPVGGSLKVGNVVIGRPSSSRVVGHSSVCTHQGCQVGAGGGTLECPCHGSAFDAFTGAVKKGPASAPLPGVALVIKGSYIHRA